jgi:Na+/H+ antiporter NhaD/arsenite permease-like protein
MVPVLELIQVNAHLINISTPAEFYFVTGTLSFLLDNTPTAITFYSLAEVLFANSECPTLMAGIPAMIMKAICIGSVLFGAMTYIANGPNFMVKSIAEHEGIKMPQFFQYMYKFSLVVILPVLILYALIFF